MCCVEFDATPHDELNLPGPSKSMAFKELGSRRWT